MADMELKEIEELVRNDIVKYKLIFDALHED